MESLEIQWAALGFWVLVSVLGGLVIFHVVAGYWYMIYGALLAILSRLAFRKLEEKSLVKQLVSAPLVSASVMVLGALSFEVIFWLPRGLGVSDHVIVAVYFVAMLILALTVRAPDAQPAEGWLFFAPLAFYAFHLLLLGWLFLRGKLSNQLGKGLLILCGAVALLLLVRFLPFAKPTPVQADEG